MTNRSTTMPAPEFSALLADPRMEMRRPPVTLPLMSLRKGANAFMAAAEGPAIPRVEKLCVTSSGQPVDIRLYRPSSDQGLPVILFFHGGGFTLGSLDTHDALCRSLALGARSAVIAVDYRLAPEWRFPAPLEDGRLVLDWLRNSGGALGLNLSRMAVCGDSAGGQIATALALSLADAGGMAFAHLALFYPLLDPLRSTPSATEFDTGYMLSGSFIEWAWESYRSAPEDLENPLFSVLRANLSSLPSTTVVTAEFDPLRDEGEAFVRQIRDKGVIAQCRRFDGMIHGFAGMPQITPAANEAIAFVADNLKHALSQG